MIYMKEIIGKYREFAKRINPDIKVIKGSEWCCYSDSREIEVPRIVVDNSLKDFIDTIEKQLEKSGHRNLIYKYDDFIWCFLHEMGHLCKPKKYKDGLIRNLLDNLNMIGFKIPDTIFIIFVCLNILKIPAQKQVMPAITNIFSIDL